MRKIERKYLAHFINAGLADEPVYERLGQDLEEYSAELGAQVETKKNILGEASVIISGYEKTGSVETFYAREGSALFERLQEIIDEGKVLEDLKTQVVEVKLWEQPQEGAYPAICEEVYVEVTAYGGDTGGYQIPFTVHYTGNKQKGLFDIKTLEFTAQ